MTNPTLAQVRRMLRMNPYHSTRRRVSTAYIVGSVAKGTARPDSDLDIALIVEPVRAKTSLQISEEYHLNFSDNSQRPTFDGRRVDFQFFYADDPELETYSKIEVE